METKRTGRQVEPAQPHHVDHPTAVNRTLAYLVRDDGWDYSVEAARAGAARSYVYGGVPVSRYPEIKAAEDEARNAQRGLWGPPCHGSTTAAASAPAPFVGSPAAEAPATAPSGAYYPNCKAARRAGAAPLLAGTPGYRPDLDGDGDGVACER